MNCFHKTMSCILKNMQICPVPKCMSMKSYNTHREASIYNPDCVYTYNVHTSIFLACFPSGLQLAA